MGGSSDHWRVGCGVGIDERLMTGEGKSECAGDT